jgi:hypothetical protein
MCRAPSITKERTAMSNDPLAPRRVAVIRALSDNGINVLPTGGGNGSPGVMVSTRRGECYLYPSAGLWEGSTNGEAIKRKLGTDATAALMRRDYCCEVERHLSESAIKVTLA